MAKVTVDKDRCIGCGFCFTNLEDVFFQDEDGLANAKEEVSEELIEEANDIKDGCPVGAIEVKVSDELNEDANDIKD